MPGNEQPLWFRCLKKSFPVSMGFLMMVAGSMAAEAASVSPGQVETIAVNQQNHTIKGRVVDTDGLPLVGVNIGVKGKKVYAVTDNNGRYTIRAPKGSTLVFSYIVEP